MKVGDYIIFIPKNGSKHMSKIPKLITGNNFVAYPELSYNKKYKIIKIDLVLNNIISFVIIDDNGVDRRSYFIDSFSLKYKVIDISKKINKILKL